MQQLDWKQYNQQICLQGVQRIKSALQTFDGEKQTLNLEPIDWPENSTLATLQRRFGLSNFERDLVLFCMAQEIDPGIGPLCAKIRGQASLSHVTFMLAYAVLPEADMNVLAPHRPLQNWHLISFEPHLTLSNAPLKINQRVMCYLLGEHTLDLELQGIIEPLSSAHLQLPLAGSHASLCEQLQHYWTDHPTGTEWPILQLFGPDISTMYPIAARLAQQTGFDLQVMSATVLPQDSNELRRLRLLWEREALLRGSILLLDAHELVGENMGRRTAIMHWLESLKTPLIVCSDDRLTSQRRSIVSYAVPTLTHQERKQLWQQHLGTAAADLHDHLDRIVSQFRLNSRSIQAACQQIQADFTPTNGSPKQEATAQKLWAICRQQALPRLEQLARRIDVKASRADLVLPDNLHATLQEMAAHVRQRSKVHEEWGFRHKNSRGLGLSAIFAGASGTGKTMAAEVMANELQLDLFRIDLSAVTSKYIGETEKNLRKIFDAAEVGGVILLFDEADALFGKRTEVKDSHDRHANIEVSYLLQRLEAYQGLAILTTNLKDSIDRAFLRRIPFTISFPFPNKEARTEIWQRVFPKRTPIEGLKFDLLSQLNVAGGNISSIALNAAVLAADADEPVMMKHILKAAQSEYSKLERPLTDTEVRGWS